MASAGCWGCNRTVNVDRLVTGLRDQTLSSILFPTDIVANADRILSDLRAGVPARARPLRVRADGEDRRGARRTLLTADLGLLLEVPEPVRC